MELKDLTTRELIEILIERVYALRKTDQWHFIESKQTIERVETILEEIKKRRVPINIEEDVP